MKAKRILAVLVVISLIVVLVACAQPTPTPTEAKPIKIGAILSLTGPIPEFGESGKLGDMFALEEVGWEIAGRPIEYIYEDDASYDSAKALDAAKKLVEVDKVDMLLAPVVSPSYWVVQPYTEEKGVLFMSQWGRYDFRPWELGKPGFDITCGSGTGTQDSYIMGKYAYEELGIKTITTMHYDEQSGYNIIGAFVDSFTEAGGIVVNEQWLPYGVLDFGPYFANMGEADALVGQLWGGEQLAMIRQFHEFGFDAKMKFISPNINNVRYQNLAELGDAIAGVYGATSYDWTIDTPANNKFVADFEATNGVKPDINSFDPYVTIKAYLAAVEKTEGNTDPEVVRDALIGLSFEGPVGTITFALEGYPIRNVYVFQAQIVNGELQWKEMYCESAVEDFGQYAKP